MAKALKIVFDEYQLARISWCLHFLANNRGSVILIGISERPLLVLKHANSLEEYVREEELIVENVKKTLDTRKCSTCTNKDLFDSIDKRTGKIVDTFLPISR